MGRAVTVTAIAALVLCVSAASAAPQDARGTGANKKTPAPQTVVVPAPQVTVNIPPVPQPLPVRLEDKETDRSLVKGTWALVGTNIIVALIGLVFGFLQRQDVRRSMDLAKESADASKDSADTAHESVHLVVVQRREALVREANAAANRVAIRATWISQLAGEVKPRLQEIWALSGRNVADLATHPYLEAANQQQRRAEELRDKALKMLPVTELSEQEVSTALRTLDEYQLQLDMMQEAITRRLDGMQAEWNVLWSRRNREQAADRILG
jgi:hypothetical protein